MPLRARRLKEKLFRIKVLEAEPIFEAVARGIIPERILDLCDVLGH
jgi:hypothetical protein